MFIVNQSFFVGEINIPNLNNPGVLERLNSFIAKYEPQVLLKLFGYPLYKLYGSETSQRMTDILEGAEYYDFGGNLRKWQGLVHDTTVSLIANYVWYFYEQSNASQTTGVNVSVPKGSSSITVSPMEKMCSAWNFFSEESTELISFLRNKKDANGVYVYPEFTDAQVMISMNFSRAINVLGI